MSVEANAQLDQTLEPMALEEEEDHENRGQHQEILLLYGQTTVTDRQLFAFAEMEEIFRAISQLASFIPLKSYNLFL